MRRWGSLSILGLFMMTGVALGQTPTAPRPAPPAPIAPQPSGPFAKLSPGNQKIAQALCNVQTNGCTPATLNSIAAAKLGGKGWGEIFHEMKAQGLVQGKTLGQVVRGFEQHQRTPGATTTTGRGRTQEFGDKGNAEGALRGSSAAVESGSSRGHGVGGEAAGMGGGHATRGEAAGMGGGAGHLGGHGGGRGR